MISAYHSEKKSWFLKGLSIFVILTFLVTQSDVQLVFAYNATTGLPAAIPSGDLAKNDKIHFSQNFDDLQQAVRDQTSESPLNAVDPMQSQLNPFAGDIPQSQIPQISTTFLTTANPLSGKSDVGATATEDQATHVMTISYAD
ncbi:MAG TPA: hypothetical protein P5246_06770, partial [Candidatus Omnitrophota bacterium]|nr:hypothetical protein [Candidatus Omnitrophota bacterium]